MTVDRKYIKVAALLVALATVVVGLVGIVYPDRLTTIRRLYFTSGGLYVAGAVRVAMGMVLIVAAPGTRWPSALRVLGTMMCLQGISANLFGLARARTILEWESAHPALLLAGAVVALAAGGFIVFAVTKVPHRLPDRPA